MPEKFCECYELVRKDFMGLTKGFIEIGGEFPLKQALDNLHAIARMDTRLIAAECITLSELAKRRKYVEDLITATKEELDRIKAGKRGK